MELTRTKGSVAIAAGTELTVVARDNDVLTVLFQNVPGRVPVSATDFLTIVGSTPTPSAALKEPPTPPITPATSANLLPLPDAPLEVPSREDLHHLLQTKKFDQLEKIAADIRQRKLEFYRGYSPMKALYNAFSSFDTDSDDSRWENVRILLEQWVAAYPDSAAARTCAGEFYIKYGWKARGSGYASTVPEEGWARLHDRLVQAKLHLEKAASLPHPDPGTFRALISVALGMGLPRGYMDAAFTRGIHIEPNYQPLYESKANYLLPRWYGEDGEWEAFAASVADARGGDEGDILYMAIVRSVQWTVGDTIFKDTHASYDRMKRGFEAAIRRAPGKSYDLNSFCFFACLAGDKSTARELFERIGGQWNKSVWSTEENFAHWFSWAK